MFYVCLFDCFWLRFIYFCNSDGMSDGMAVFSCVGRCCARFGVVLFEDIKGESADRFVVDCLLEFK